MSINTVFLQLSADDQQELGDALDEYSGQPGDEAADLELEAMSRVTPRGGLPTNDGRR